VTGRPRPDGEGSGPGGGGRGGRGGGEADAGTAGQPSPSHLGRSVEDMAIAARHDAPLTWDDLQRLPDDGLRYELVDGELLVTPAPAPIHQRVAFNLAVLLRAAVPPGHEVLMAPLDWYVSATTVFEPDVLVVRSDDLTDRRLEGTPVLAVEVLSSSTRLRDMGIKQRAYETAGLGWYWVVDPAEPRLTVFRLADGRYVEHAVVTGGDAYVGTQPVAVVVVPGELVEPGRPGG